MLGSCVVEVTPAVVLLKAYFVVKFARAGLCSTEVILAGVVLLGT